MNHSQNESLAAERGIIDALNRGLFSEAHAMQLLGITNNQQFQAKKNLLGMNGSEEAVHEGSIVDGFVHYWQSRNTELE